MRNFYLVRHGKVDFPGGHRRCIGRADYPLDESGRAQARALGSYFGTQLIRTDQCRFSVFCSPLKRAKETAELLSSGRWPVYEKEGLIELDMGEWEEEPLANLHKELQSEPPHGETRRDGLARFRKAVEEIRRETADDIICVAHAGVNCCFLSELLQLPLEISRSLPQPYGGISRIQLQEDGSLTVVDTGRMPGRAPDRKACEEIWRHYRTPEPVIKHCMAVAKIAVEIGRKIPGLDLELIESAALLHDVMRAREKHAVVGAQVLVREGYPEVAEIVRQHHELDQDRLDEAAIVFFADKLVCGDKVVSLDERFSASVKKCRESGAGYAHEQRYRMARKIQDEIRQKSGPVRQSGNILSAGKETMFCAM